MVRAHHAFGAVGAEAVVGAAAVKVAAGARAVRAVLAAKALGGALLLALAAAARAAPPADVTVILGRHCLECHSGEHPKGDFAMTDLIARWGASPAEEDRAAWLNMRNRVQGHEMPPAKRPQPSDGERDALVAAITAAIPDSAPKLSSGVRRLNRSEYRRAVRDLLGVDFDAGEFLPADDSGNGFDTGADALTLSPLVVERFVEAAERVAVAAVSDERLGFIDRLYEFKDLKREGTGSFVGTAHLLHTFGRISAPIEVVIPGKYRVCVTAWGEQAGPDPVRFAVKIDNQATVTTLDVPQVRESPGTFEVDVNLLKGRRTIDLVFINDYYHPTDPDPSQRDRNGAISSIGVHGPIDPPPTGSFDAILSAHGGPPTDGAALARVVADLATRAFRRPVTEEEVAELLAIAPADSGVRARLRGAIVGILASPSFLIRAERGMVSGYAAASRLAGFLWSSVPDRAILSEAGAGSLDTAKGRVAVAERMLADPRARALAEEFATQWLHVREIDRRMPDPTRFQGVDAALLDSMREETIRYFHAILQENRPVRELIDSDWAMANERLLAHYGWPHPGAPAGADGWMRVQLPADERGGVLRHASVLLTTSNPSRTSPVKRGRFVLDAILDTPPKPPPPGVPQLPPEVDSADASIAEMMARHRTDPSCAACHRSLDSVGLAFESYDAVGRRRTVPAPEAAELPDGRTFTGPDGLRTLLAHDPSLARTLARRMLVFATGRSLSGKDRSACDAMVASLGAEPTLRDIVLGVISLDSFAGNATR